MKADTIDVNKNVLIWIRKTSGYSVEEIANKLKTSIDFINDVENGTEKLTLSQLKKLSSIYKKPVALFFLSKPKKEYNMPRDFRSIPEKNNIFDKKTISIINKARNIQNILKDLQKNINYKNREKIRRANINDNPENIANEYRQLFEFDENKQINFKNSYDVYKYLRHSIETFDVFTFQFSIPIGDARGFTLNDEKPNIMVINSADKIEARIFTIMHEFGHIILGEGGIDLPEENDSNQNDIERWCNRFASSFLLPESLADDLFKNVDNITMDKTLVRLSNKYSISRLFLLVKMLNLNYITKDEFDSLKYSHKNEKKLNKKDKDKYSVIPQERTCVSQMGYKFISIVESNYQEDFITYNDVLDLLSIKSKNYDKVIERVMK